MTPRLTIPIILAGASVLLAPSCDRDDPTAERDRRVDEEVRTRVELECQQRIVAIVGGWPMPSPTVGEYAIRTRFSDIHHRLMEMPGDGCTAQQSQSAQELSRVASDLVTAAGMAEGALDAAERTNGRLDPADFRKIEALLGQFDSRRQVLRNEMTRMTVEHGQAERRATAR